MPKKAPAPPVKFPNSPRINQTLANVTDFARMRGVSRQAIYLAIHEGRIIPILIGIGEDVFIDTHVYPTKKQIFKQSKKVSS